MKIFEAIRDAIDDLSYYDTCRESVEKALALVDELERCMIHQKNHHAVAANGNDYHGGGYDALEKILNMEVNNE